MKLRQVIACALTLAVTSASAPLTVFAAQNAPVQNGGQNTATLAGTAKAEAKKPYSDFSVRARDSKAGTIATTQPLDQNAMFSMAGLPPANYVVELLNKDNKVICTEGPFDVTGRVREKTDVKIDCGHVPVAWWLLGAAAAAGITAGVVASGNSSPSR